MTNEETINNQARALWYIDMDWYQQNKRSLATLARDCLCPKCARQLTAERKDIPADTLLATIKDCCSHSPGFIDEGLPILESVFRLFLANGNQPLNLEELGRQLGERRSSDTYRTSTEILSRLLKKDEYYGLREVQDQSNQANALS